MQIIVQIKTNYGNEAIYPICKMAEGFAAIAGTKTLTRQTLRMIKNMGFEIEIQSPKISF
jgi:hypothetical protein